MRSGVLDKKSFNDCQEKVQTKKAAGKEKSVSTSGSTELDGEEEERKTWIYCKG